MDQTLQTSAGWLPSRMIYLKMAIPRAYSFSASASPNLAPVSRYLLTALTYCAFVLGDKFAESIGLKSYRNGEFCVHNLHPILAYISLFILSIVAIYLTNQDILIMRISSNSFTPQHRAWQLEGTKADLGSERKIPTLIRRRVLIYVLLAWDCPTTG